MKLNKITGSVWILSLVSFFTDTASEMLYPVLPLYLQTIGFSVLLIGILEGLAEAVTGLSKGFFGELSDHSGRRVPFVQAGYALSAISKPMMAVFALPLWVFMARTIDRFGKGIRTGARDAILSGQASQQTKGAVFGFHRSMDTMGAVLGPLLALLYLHFNPGNYRMLFFITFIPGLLAVISTLLLKEKKTPVKKVSGKVSFFSFLKYWKSSPVAYRKLVIGLLIFALFNSSDVFLLLKAKEAGLYDSMVIGIYIFYNLVYALFAFPLGMLADKLGLKTIFIGGLILFAVVYLGMSVNTSLAGFYALFFLYGVYAAGTEGIAKAWISNIIHRKDTATAIGTYSGFQSICSLLASTFTGLIWFSLGSKIALLAIAIATILVIVYLVMVVKAPQNEVGTG